MTAAGTGSPPPRQPLQAVGGAGDQGALPGRTARWGPPVRARTHFGGAGSRLRRDGGRGASAPASRQSAGAETVQGHRTGPLGSGRCLPPPWIEPDALPPDTPAGRGPPREPSRRDGPAPLKPWSEAHRGAGPTRGTHREGASAGTSLAAGVGGGEQRDEIRATRSLLRSSAARRPSTCRRPSRSASPPSPSASRSRRPRRTRMSP